MSDWDGSEVRPKLASGRLMRGKSVYHTLNHHDNLIFMFNRSLTLPSSGEETFFLWGPRQAGKSTLLRRCYPDGRWIDLLKSDEFRRYATRPELLRQPAGCLRTASAENDGSSGRRSSTLRTSGS